MKEYCKLLSVLCTVFSLVIFQPKSFAQVFVPESNLVANGDFMSRDPQQRPLRWNTGFGLQTATSSAEERHSSRTDDKSLRMSDTSLTDSILIRSEKRIVSPGVRYLASTWVKGKSGKPATLNLEFWDQNHVIVGRKSLTPEFTTGWEKRDMELIAPDKSTHVTVSVTTGRGETGLSFWDDINLHREVRYEADLKKGVRELFADDYRIEQLTDVERVIHPGEKSGPVMLPTEPWEGNSVYIYGTVLKDEPAGSRYRMWYTSYLTGTYYLCYATSKDGTKWEKPNLGVVEFKGNKNNNIVRVGGGTLVYDPMDKDPARRYKLMAFESGVKFGYGVHFSPDGLTWTEHLGNPVLQYGDVSNIAYDKSKGLFIASTKQRMLLSNTSVTSAKNDRAAFISVSKDFINWTAPDAPGSLWTIAVEGDHFDDMLVMSKGGIESNIYGMPVYPYESIYIGTPWAFDIKTYNTGEFANTGDGRIQPQLAASRDLKHWSRPNRDPLIPLGEAGSWDDGTLYNSTTMQVSAKEMSMYYGAMNLPHGGSTKEQTQFARIGKASWRRDGFVSLYNGGDDIGKITTKPIFINGNELKVNAKLKKAGNLKVEIIDKAGNPIPGYSVTDAVEIQDDQFEKTVSWKSGSGLLKLKGHEVRLRFYLTGGNLFSYWIK